MRHVPPSVTLRSEARWSRFRRGSDRRSEGSALLREPHIVLAFSAAIVLLAEYAAVERGSAAWILLGALASLVAFFVAWRLQDRLRLVPLLLLSLAFQLAWIGLHLHLGLDSVDSSVLYRVWGNELLDGHYPDAQYPPGAVLLFAFDALVGGGPTRTAHAFVMVPFELVTIAAVWALRTRWSAWFAALVALWPMNAFSWEFRFDLFPTALLALGLLFAVRQRWLVSGAVLGLGAAAKWTPGLAAAALVISLLADRRVRTAAVHAASFALVFALLHIPFLIWSPSEALYSYRYFSGQGVTGETLWYLLLAPFGSADVSLHEFWLPADVPGWTNPATVTAQLLVLAALGFSAWRARASVRASVAIAAVTPAVFLLVNRVFSPQYLVLMLVAWAIAGVLLVESRREQLALGLAIMAATTANALVYPYTIFQFGLWRLASAALFAVGVAISLWLTWRALERSSAQEAQRAAAPRGSLVSTEAH
jgi:Glycosyltransferase family 87